MEIISIEDLIKVLEKSSFKYEISNCDDGCCPDYVDLIDSKELISELRKRIKKEKCSGCNKEMLESDFDLKCKDVDGNIYYYCSNDCIK